MLASWQYHYFNNHYLFTLSPYLFYLSNQSYLNKLNIMSSKKHMEPQERVISKIIWWNGNMSPVCPRPGYFTLLLSVILNFWLTGQSLPCISDCSCVHWKWAELVKGYLYFGALRIIILKSGRMSRLLVNNAPDYR